MFSAHVAPAFLIKAYDESFDLFILIIASLIIDIVWIALLILGIEEIGSARYSHSILIGIILTGVFFVIFTWKYCPIHGIGYSIPVLAHIGFDWLTHPIIYFVWTITIPGVNFWGISLLFSWFLEIVIIGISWSIFFKTLYWEKKRDERLPYILLIITLVLSIPVLFLPV